MPTPDSLPRADRDHRLLHVAAAQGGAGSTHGYDICDHNALNQELGSEQDFDAFACELRARGMGLILDFVPNHMGLDPSANLWWRDVLQHGQASPFADFFDIDWDPITPELKGRILLPILQDGYGEVLDRGELRLASRPASCSCTTSTGGCRSNRVRRCRAEERASPRSANQRVPIGQIESRRMAGVSRTF